jgi:hypothetical protein
MIDRMGEWFIAFALQGEESTISTHNRTCRIVFGMAIAFEIVDANFDHFA